MKIQNKLESSTLELKIAINNEQITDEVDQLLENLDSDQLAELILQVLKRELIQTPSLQTQINSQASIAANKVRDRFNLWCNFNEDEQILTIHSHDFWNLSKEEREIDQKTINYRECDPDTLNPEEPFGYFWQEYKYGDLSVTQALWQNFYLPVINIATYQIEEGLNQSQSWQNYRQKLIEEVKIMIPTMIKDSLLSYFLEQVNLWMKEKASQTLTSSSFQQKNKQQTIANLLNGTSQNRIYYPGEQPNLDFPNPSNFQ